MFDFKNTSVYRAVKIARFPLFKFAELLSGLFLIFIFGSLFLLLLSFVGIIASRIALKFLVFSVSFYFIFYDLNLFFDSKIKKMTPAGKLETAQNLAEFLSFDSAKIVEDSIKLCKRKKIINNSTALFYSGVKNSKEISAICLRLGLETKKLKNGLKNYLEKMPKVADSVLFFSEDWEKTIVESQKASLEMGHNTIGEKEFLIGLARTDEFLKKLLLEYDLKEEDVKNLAMWLDSAQNSFKRNKEFWSYENLSAKGSFGKDFSSGYTITLDRYSIDWRRVVSRWAFKEIIGHKKEIEQLQIILAKSELANALIVGEDGTGRKSIIQALAQKCYLGQSLPELNNKRVVELDMVALTANIQNPEDLEMILDRIFFEAVLSGNVILVIDQLENYVYISKILSKYLAMPNFQFVGITSYDGLHKNIEQNSSFAEFFEKIEVQEINETEAIKTVQNVALDLEYKYKIFILYPSVREIVNLTGKYIPSLPFPKKALDVLREVVVYVQAQKEKIVLPHHVAEVISKRTEIPVGKMDVKEKEVLMNLENLIHQRIVNQEEAVKGISVAMRRARAGIASKTRPMGTFLFMGPTGVGKTETAKALAQIYFGSEQKMIRIDMSEFQAISDISRLIGSTSPVEIQGLLTTPVRETPFSLVLLDEIEKAHPDILNLLLQILDEGRITDGQGRKVVFTNTIIICTSNAGAEIIFKQVEAGQEIKKDEFLDSLFEQKIFKPEFVNRFDASIIFHPLTRDNLLKIAQLNLQSLQKNLKEKEIDFIITEELKEKIVELSYKPVFGAREMRRVIQDKVENVIAEALISEKIKKGDRVQINPENFELVINPS